MQQHFAIYICNIIKYMTKLKVSKCAMSVQILDQIHKMLDWIHRMLGFAGLTR